MSAPPAAGLALPQTSQPVSQPDTQPAGTQKVIKDSTGATRTMDKQPQAGIRPQQSVATAIQRAEKQQSAIAPATGNWTASIFNAEFNSGLALRKVLEQRAAFYRQAGDGQSYLKNLNEITVANSTLENLAVQKAINNFETNGDPRLLTAMVNQSEGRPNAFLIQPRSDGKFNIQQDGQTVAEAQSSSQIVNRFRKLASQKYTASVNAAQVTRRVAAADNAAKLTADLVKLRTEKGLDAYIEQLKKENKLTDVGGTPYLSTADGAVYALTSREPTKEELEIDRNLEVVVIPQRVFSGAFSTESASDQLQQLQKRVLK